MKHFAIILLIVGLFAMLALQRSCSVQRPSPSEGAFVQYLYELKSPYIVSDVRVIGLPELPEDEGYATVRSYCITAKKRLEGTELNWGPMNIGEKRCFVERVLYRRDAASDRYVVVSSEKFKPVPAK